MKTIGLLGGMSWESTATYYQLINEGVKHKLGGLHSAKIILYSVDFAPLERFQHDGDWSEIACMLAEKALCVKSAGADFLLICTNTMHKVAPYIEEKISIPLLHIADATAQSLITQGIKKVGLLGTAFTMEDDFYKGRLHEKHGLNVLVPKDYDRQIVHQVIYQELCQGKVTEASKEAFLRIIGDLQEQGAEGVILGCTEIGLLVNQSDTHVSLFDTTHIHADFAIETALSLG
ncbi:aspartate/glutamate racemase family protein [Zooshikella harenae]|uniref:Aspartate/glutamate racemase family protein n=1 Tax=Zooshikella harenae TaxID=2827238 RepID=A0ABS5ZJ67_9GAMM|nr:aspartate/glutamate racemase family protein [Zooshikella harenae]MBU2713975.1 aspartate/glutamate racemase family protein [Zooshikella harenae]